MMSSIDQYQHAEAVKIILHPADTETDTHRNATWGKGFQE